MSTLLINLFIGLLITKSYCQYILPSDKEVTYSSANKGLDRIPLPIPKVCPKNMLPYPIDVGIVRFCKCFPKYLYSPLSGTCHEAFRQGPCRVGEYFVLPIGNITPECQENPCHHDGMVPYQGFCYTLKTLTDKPCGYHVLGVNSLGDFELGNNIVDVNESTFQLECVKREPLKFVPFSGIFDAPSFCRNNLINVDGVCIEPAR